jgi:hypothetical protein
MWGQPPPAVRGAKHRHFSMQAHPRPPFLSCGVAMTALVPSQHGSSLPSRGGIPICYNFLQPPSCKNRIVEEWLAVFV